MIEINTIQDYQKFTPTTFIRGDSWATDLAHVTNGLYSESGEVAGCYQKFFRGDYGAGHRKMRVSKELGGLMYYISMLCNLEGLDLLDIISENAEILQDRKQRGVIRGDGDTR